MSQELMEAVAMVPKLIEAGRITVSISMKGNLTKWNMLNLENGFTARGTERKHWTGRPSRTGLHSKHMTHAEYVAAYRKLKKQNEPAL